MKRVFIAFLSLLCVVFSAQAQGLKWNQAYQAYIDKYKDVAIAGMIDYGVPASISLAQGLLESGAGRSNLALRSNNHFGIKCHGWTGRAVYHDDDEAGECFRAYDSVLESYEDHCSFLRNRPRYQALFRLDKRDYRGWAYGLKRAGYATNPYYAQRLIAIIELYQLYKYDSATSYDRFVAKEKATAREKLDNIFRPDKAVPHSETGAHQVHKYNDNYYIVARRGDTYKSLAKEMHISARKLAKYNERKKRDVIKQGDFVWLKKKRKKAPKQFKKNPYRVTSSESLYDISQRYGVRLKSLVKKNPKIAERGLRIGDRVRLY